MEEDENLLLSKINPSESIKSSKIKLVQNRNAMETGQSSGGEIEGDPQEITHLFKNTIKNVCDECVEVSLMLSDVDITHPSVTRKLNPEFLTTIALENTFYLIALFTSAF